MEQEQLQARRAIEALRAGVPNREAVALLGITAPAIEERLLELLGRTEQPDAAPVVPSGFLVAGDFGSGKSHLLEYCRHLAQRQRFVTSTIVISKETPLYDPIKLFRDAIAAAVVPDRRGSALAQLAEAIDFRSEQYGEFYAWSQSARDLNARFAASVYLFQQAQQDPELQDQIIQFWAGDPIGISDLKRALRAHGERITYSFDKVDARALALQRFRFAARLMKAAGYYGWVLLIDEVELIARYSIQQRARSYAEIARWTGTLREELYPGIISVFAITSDFEAVVLDQRQDREKVPARLRATGKSAEELIAAQAERGMRVLSRAYKLPPPGRTAIMRCYDRLRTLHGVAYDWDPPPVGSAPYSSSTSMREYVRWWITEWDLKRLFPEYQPRIEVSALAPDLSEDFTLEEVEEPPGDVLSGAPDPHSSPWE